MSLTAEDAGGDMLHFDFIYLPAAVSFATSGQGLYSQRFLFLELVLFLELFLELSIFLEKF